MTQPNTKSTSTALDSCEAIDGYQAFRLSTEMTCTSRSKSTLDSCCNNHAVPIVNNVNNTTASITTLITSSLVGTNKQALRHRCFRCSEAELFHAQKCQIYSFPTLIFLHIVYCSVTSVSVILCHLTFNSIS